MIFAHQPDIFIQKLNELLRNKIGYYWSQGKPQEKVHFIFEHATTEYVLIKVTNSVPNDLRSIKVNAGRNLYFNCIIEHYEFCSIKNKQLNNCCVFLDKSFYYRKTFVYKGRHESCDSIFSVSQIRFIFSPSIRCQKEVSTKVIDKIKFKEIKNGFAQAKSELVFEKVRQKPQPISEHSLDKFICEFFAKTYHYVLYLNKEKKYTLVTCNSKSNKIYVDYYRNKEEVIKKIKIILEID